MVKEVRLPALGEGIASGNIVNLLVREGDSVEAEQPVLEIETDKAVAEVPSTVAGRIVKMLVKPGDNAKVGSPLFQVEAAGGNGGDSQKGKPAQSAGGQDATLEAERQAAGDEHRGEETDSSNAKREESAQTEPQASSSREVKLPSLGEGIAGGTIVSVLVKAGDAVEAEQPLVEIETDKAVAEVPSPVSGIVKRIAVKAGDAIKVGAVLAEIEAKGGAPSKASGKGEAQQGSAAPMPVPAPKASSGASASQEAREAAQTSPAVPGPVPGATSADDDRGTIPAGPATRRLARELGVELRRVTGSGPGGRITSDDVKAFVREGAASGGTASGAVSVSAPPLPDFSKWGAIERKPLTSLRRKIAEQMTLSWSIPIVTHYDQADITDLEAVRKKMAPGVKAKGGALTITTLLIPAVVHALKAIPQMNSSLDLARGELILKAHYHIGIAVDTEQGLIVPVIKDADQKSVMALSMELAELAAKTRSRKVGANDLQGATFTISNLGGVGGTAFTPLVNPPQVGILGVARSAQMPVWDGSAFQPRLMMPICVSYDHRVVDGADAARFCRAICEKLENLPELLLG